jgi:Fe-S-cluster containining protein
VTTDGGGPAPDHSSSEAPWYAEGLRFECTQCGNCCSGGPGAVWFTPDEAEAMAKAVGLPLDRFTDEYTRRIGGRRSLKETVRGGMHDCVFLDRDSRPGKAVCRIYKARPSQCRTWPWWPENLESPAAWDWTKRRTPCPGMGRGPVHPLVEITIGLTGGG